jgi:hypothetical protein
MTSERRPLPRFNHVAMSVPAELLDEDHRRDILEFYGEVFGWQEAPGMTLDRERLVLMAHRLDQFVFLIADDDPMRAPRLDHWGQAVSSRQELDAVYQRARRAGERDDRVDLVDISVDEHPGVRIHAFYVGFLLPMMVETQWFEWDR